MFHGKEQHLLKPRGGKEFGLLRNGKTACVCVHIRTRVCVCVCMILITGWSEMDAD